MASIVWLTVWLIQGTPNLEWFGTWNDWAVSLLGRIVFDVSVAAKRAPAGAAESAPEWDEGRPCGTAL